MWLPTLTPGTRETRAIVTSWASANGSKSRSSTPASSATNSVLSVSLTVSAWEQKEVSDLLSNPAHRSDLLAAVPRPHRRFGRDGCWRPLARRHGRHPRLRQEHARHPDCSWTTQPTRFDGLRRNDQARIVRRWSRRPTQGNARHRLCVPKLRPIPANGPDRRGREDSIRDGSKLVPWARRLWRGELILTLQKLISDVHGQHDGLRHRGPRYGAPRIIFLPRRIPRKARRVRLDRRLHAKPAREEHPAPRHHDQGGFRKRHGGSAVCDGANG